MEDCNLHEMSNTNHHPTSITTEQMENWDVDFELEMRNPRLGSPSCLRRNGEMCERRAGTMGWSWRLNLTTWMLNLGTKTRAELSLLGRGVLRFLSLHL